MLSYRHAYHAGNHADVFKHLCLCLLIDKLVQKDKPMTYIDTHAAAGWYDLNGEMAQKTAEFVDGIDRLSKAENLSEPVQAYLSVVRRFRDKNVYPGSPAIAAELLRETDKLVFLELHKSDFDILKRNMGRDRRVFCHYRDGLEGALAICPPNPKRGMVLIYPPYELSDEYPQIASLVKQLHKKWPIGVIAIWYPLLAKARNRAPFLLQRLIESKPASLFVAELWVKAQDDEFGMHGSGMAFINLPWQLDRQIAEVLPSLIDKLADRGGGWRTEWLVEAK